MGSKHNTGMSLGYLVVLVILVNLVNLVIAITIFCFDFFGNLKCMIQISHLCGTYRHNCNQDLSVCLL